MRQLTLDEKINLKAQLAGKRVPAYILVRLTMAEALFLYPHCFGKPAALYSNPRRWRRQRAIPIEHTPRFRQLEEDYTNRCF